MTFYKKNFQRNQQGLTLTELIVSSILISIVLAGAAGFSISLRQMEETTGRGAILNMQTGAAINHIKMNALVAIGYKGDPGIMVDEFASPPYFSFRHDVNDTPIDYSDDEWIVYTDGGIPNTMYFCTQDVSLGYDHIPKITPGDPCELPDGTAPDNLVLLNNISTIDFDFDPDSGPGKFYFEINITTINNPNLAADPIKNPTFTMHEKISPISHSW